MTQSETRWNERACDGCPYTTRCLFESGLPKGGIHGDIQHEIIVAEISELRVREQHIREMPKYGKAWSETIWRGSLDNSRIDVYAHTHEHEYLR